MNNKPFTLEEFRSIYSKVPKLTIDPVIRMDGGIVLSKRKGEEHGWAGKWNLPGGTVFYREGVENAVHRIIEKETGLKVNIVKLLGFVEFLSEEKERGFGYSVSLNFLCDYVSGGLKPDEDASDIKVFKELPEDLVIEQKEFIQKHWEEIF